MENRKNQLVWCNWLALADILLANGYELNLNLPKFPRSFYFFFLSDFMHFQKKDSVLFYLFFSLQLFTAKCYCSRCREFCNSQSLRDSHIIKAPRSIYQYSSMASRLSGQTSILKVSSVNWETKATLKIYNADPKASEEDKSKLGINCAGVADFLIVKKFSKCRENGIDRHLWQLQHNSCFLWL